MFVLHSQGDVKLWYQYIHFCQEKNQENELSRVYGRALAVHPTETGNTNQWEFCVPNTHAEILSHLL